MRHVLDARDCKGLEAQRTVRPELTQHSGKGNGPLKVIIMEKQNASVSLNIKLLDFTLKAKKTPTTPTGREALKYAEATGDIANNHHRRGRVCIHKVQRGPVSDTEGHEGQSEHRSYGSVAPPQMQRIRHIINLASAQASRDHEANNTVSCGKHSERALHMAQNTTLHEPVYHHGDDIIR